MAILARGGISKLALGKLWTRWKISHTKPSKSETNEERNLRRGNNAADWFANRGCELHYDMDNIRSRVTFMAERIHA